MSFRLSTAALAAAALTVAAAAPLLATAARKAHPARPAAVAAAPAPTPAEVVHTRTTGLKEMGAAFKNIRDGLSASEPQMILIQQSARTIKNSSQAMYRWFPAGSGPQPGLKTSAKPEIWTKPAEFRAAQDQLARAADALQTAATAGNADAIKAAARGLGGACKNCHDQFKVPEQH